jgi:hypothetical protein
VKTKPTPTFLTIAASAIVLLLFSILKWVPAFVLYGLVVVITICAGLLVRRLRTHILSSWPLLEAHLESKTITQMGGRRPFYRLEIGYSYSLDGHIYGGSYQEDFKKEEEAEHRFQNLSRFGFRVRVDPRRPNRSAFDPYRDF